MSLYGVDIPIRANFQAFLRDTRTGKVLDYRSGHNTMTATGAAWLLRRMVSTNPADPALPALSTHVLKYIGLGCGGAMQTDGRFANTQPETYLAENIEDPVPIGASGGTSTYLKQIEPVAENARYFPTDVILRARASIAEAEVTFAGAETRASAVSVGTQVPVSEAGLFLSSAAASYTAGGPLPGEVDPLQPNGLAFYKTFSPVTLTPNAVFEILWEIKAA